MDSYKEFPWCYVTLDIEGWNLDAHNRERIVDSIKAHSTCLNGRVAICPAISFLNLAHETMAETYGTPITITYFSVMPPVLELDDDVSVLQDLCYKVYIRSHGDAEIQEPVKKYGGGRGHTLKESGVSNMGYKEFKRLLTELVGVDE